jgi:catechol 2,3-dioxygenase-like lactoylglutathione lyase family enzyme
VPSTKTRVSKISTVVITVADIDGQIEFYTDKLGLEKRVDIPFGGQYRWVEVGPVDAETTIALAPPPPDGETPGKKDTGISLYTEDIDAYHAELKDAGVDRPRGQPDGRPRSAAVLASRPRGQHAHGRWLSRSKLASGSGARA